MGEVREPVKKCSIEKKNRIIKKGFELMCTRGYHNVSCIDIAKYADVSTGLIYQYFTDKRAIFLAGVKNYATEILFPIHSIAEEKTMLIGNLESIIYEWVEGFVKVHELEKVAHEELIAMSHLDDEVSSLFYQQEVSMTNQISKILKHQGFAIENMKEKIHIIINLVDSYCHEVVYHQHPEIDYEVMHQVLIQTILFLLKEKSN